MMRMWTLYADAPPASVYRFMLKYGQSLSFNNLPLFVSLCTLRDQRPPAPSSEPVLSAGAAFWCADHQIVTRDHLLWERACRKPAWQSISSRVENVLSFLWNLYLPKEACQHPYPEHEGLCDYVRETVWTAKNLYDGNPPKEGVIHLHRRHSQRRFRALLLLHTGALGTQRKLQEDYAQTDWLYAAL